MDLSFLFLLKYFSFINSLTVKITALYGLAMAYAGSQNQDLNPVFTEVLEDFSFGYDVSAFCSLGLGLVFVGSGDEDIVGSLISVSNL